MCEIYLTVQVGLPVSFQNSTILGIVAPVVEAIPVCIRREVRLIG